MGTTAVGVAVFAAAGCGERTEPQGTALPEPTPVANVTMTEYRFAVEGGVPSGRVVFRFRNVGRVPHRVTLVPLPEDLPPIDAQLAGSERRYLEPFAGAPEHRPGTTATFAVDLEPGRRYGIVCFTVDSDNRSHAQKGMSAEFRAGGRARQEAPTGTAPGPQPRPPGADKEPASP